MSLLVCGACGEHLAPPAVDIPEPVLRCGACGFRRTFRRLPLYCVSGPSGTGKSTVGLRLGEELGDRFVVLEQDVLWVAGLRDPADDHRVFRSTWLRMAATIGQNGRPVVLCGTVAPPEFERLPERGLFSSIHYAALTCEPPVLAARLRARPAWREWDEARIVEMLDYAAWVEKNAATLEPPMTLIDTTHAAVTSTTREVADWIEARAASTP